MSYWASKDRHGLLWGWHRCVGEQFPICRDNYEPCNNIAETTGADTLIKFGNEWGKSDSGAFQHPRQVKHTNWRFLDNPEIPQLLWPGAHNPKGSKDWVRFVPSELLTSQHTESGTERINGLLKHHSQGTISEWQQIAPPHDVVYRLPKRALIVNLSEPNYRFYYDTTISAWTQHWITQLESLGYEVEVRQKPGRSQRKQGNQLSDQLHTGKYQITVSQHSVAAMESILAGVPAVVTGIHGTGPLGTPWEEFAQGGLRLPQEAEVEQWVDTLLGNTRHKSEIFSGGTYAR